MHAQDATLSRVSSGSSCSEEEVEWSCDENGEIRKQLSLAATQEKQTGFWPLVCSFLSLLGLGALISVIAFIHILHSHRSDHNGDARSSFWCSADFNDLRSEIVPRPLPSMAFKAMHACADGEERSAGCDAAQASVSEYAREHRDDSLCGEDGQPCLWELLTADYGEEGEEGEEEDKGRRVMDIVCIPPSCVGVLGQLEWELAKEEFCAKSRAESCMVHLRCTTNVTQNWT